MNNRYGLITKDIVTEATFQFQVGDVLVSLTARDSVSTTTSTIGQSRSSTIMTTATTTAMSARQYPGNSTVTNTISVNPFLSPAGSPKHHRPMSHSPPKSIRSPDYPSLSIHQPMNYYANVQMTPLQLDAESRKRRWSAPDTIEEEDLSKRGRPE